MAGAWLQRLAKRKRLIVGVSAGILALVAYGILVSLASDPITGVWITAALPEERAEFELQGRYRLVDELGTVNAGKWRASRGQVNRLSYLGSRGEVEGWAFVLLEKPEDAELHQSRDTSLTPMPRSYRGYVLTPDSAEEGEERFFLMEGRLWGNQSYYKRPESALLAWWRDLRARLGW